MGEGGLIIWKEQPVMTNTTDNRIAILKRILMSGIFHLLSHSGLLSKVLCLHYGTGTLPQGYHNGTVSNPLNR
jgi:hypothetical protein